MVPHQLTADIEAKAHPASMVIRMRLIVALEETGAAVGRDADAVIADLELGLARWRHADADVDQPAARAELDRIVDQIREDLLHADLVNLSNQALGYVKAQRMVSSARACALYDVDDDPDEVGRFPLEYEMTGV